MKTVLAFVFAGVLAASSALAGPYAGLAGDTPNSGPEGSGNFVSGKPGNPAKAKSGRSATKSLKSTTSSGSSR
jgi:hypothetical protein